MGIIRSACCILAALAIAPAGAGSPSGALPADIAEFLAEAAKFTQAEIATLEDGRVIARVEAGSVNTELITIAAVKVRSPRARVVAYYGQMVSWVDGKVTLGFGRFSSPPALADVGTLELDAADVNAIRTCKPGNCDIRIGGAGLDTIRDAVDWQAADADAQVHRLVRKAIVDYVTAYQARGDEALVTYNDRAKPVSLAEHWRGLLAASRYFHQYQPALRDYVAAYPKATLPGGRDIFYWVKEDFGLKPIVSVVHGVVYEPSQAADRTTVVQKQIYASHYYDASVAVATLAGATDGGRPVTYMVYANRSRGDMLKGGFGGIKRAVARDQARKAAEDTLGAMRTALEAAGAAATGPSASGRPTG